MRSAALVVVLLIAVPASVLVSTLSLRQFSAQAHAVQSNDPLTHFAAAKKKNKSPSTKTPSTKNSSTKDSSTKSSSNKGSPKKGSPKKGAPAPSPSVNSSYANMPLAERALIQFDLAFTNYYNGLIDGDFNEKAITAVKAFQRDNKHPQTGVLTPAERAALAASSKAKQERLGWRIVDDNVTGAQVGLPTTQVPNVSPGRNGTRWSSAQGQIQVETFRIREPGTTLANVHEQQRKEPPGRTFSTNTLREDYFILAGMQGLKKFYVRAAVKDAEVRGITILWDQATEGIMDPLAVAMVGAFSPFPGTGLASLIGPPPRRKVDYGTGIIVTGDGHVLTDRQVTDGCSVIQVAGYGDANFVAEDQTAGLSLIRIFGAGELAPLALLHEGARAGNLTLVGIADPQNQGGASAITTVSARLEGDSLQPPPPLGFAGAAALDGQGRFYGIVALKAPVLATNGSPPPTQAGVVTVETVRKFLDTQSVTPATGDGGVAAARQSVVRVICVRK